MGNRDLYLIVIPSLTIGGAEKEALYYAKTIKERDLGTPLVVGLGRDGELRKRLTSLGIECRSFNSSSFMYGTRSQKVMTLFRWWFQVLKWQPSVIIGMTYWPDILCGLVWRLTGAKRFYWVQFSVDSSIGLTFWERWVQSTHPTYISNGVAGRTFIAERHGIRTKEVRIIRNALEFPETALLGTKEKTDPTIHLLMTSNFFYQKDHTTVLRALATYREQVDAKPIKLHLLGSAPGVSQQLLVAKSLAFDLGLNGIVEFHGTVENIQPFLLMADIGILSTRSEGVSNAILEYMAYALPVIATDILANRDALGPQNEEWLFPVEDVEALTERLSSMIALSDRNVIGHKNRLWVEKRHSISIFEAQLLQSLATDQ